VDRELFRSALGNVIRNAFKFTHAGGAVTIRASTIGNEVVIEVEDQCGGLSGDPEALFMSATRTEPASG
jgi:hypothetical protein